MTETLQSTIYEQHSMPSQAGNLQDLNSYSNLRPESSFIIGPDPDHPENNSSRQEQQQQFAHHPGPSEMGLGFMTNLESSDDSRYTSDAGATQHQSHYSSIHDTQVVSAPSSVPFFPPVFSPNALSSNASQYSNSAPPYLNSNPVSNYTSYSSSLSDMAAPSMSSGVIRNSPTSRHNSLHQTGIDHRGAAKSMYGGSIPSLGGSLGRRPFSDSPPQSAHQMSPSSSSGFTSPQQLNMDSPHLHGSSSGQNAHDPPPLNPIQRLQENITTADGTPVRPEIIGKIDKGFFLAENDWTCYRRNYFQVSVSYTLNPMVAQGTPIYIQLSPGGQSHQIHAWAMTISAVVDNEHGKAIELVMHTPKRDKGPQLKIEKQVLAPRSVNTTYHTTGALASLGGNTTDGSRTLFDPAAPFSNGQQPPACEHTFERIQFKQATANNGKRRARQQYYHLMLELWVDLGVSMGEQRWKKVAYRASPPMVVRGRSPGHYHAERRGSNASGGASGANGNMGGYGGSNGSMMGRPGDVLGRPGSIMGGAAGMQQYGNAYGAQQAREHCERFNLTIPAEPIMTQEEEEKFLGQGGYTYYPGALQEPNIMHTSLPPFQHRQDNGNNGYGPQRIKQEYNGYGLPSPNVIGLRPIMNSSPATDSWGRHCGGRFEGVTSTRGYYPSNIIHSDVNAS